MNSEDEMEAGDVHGEPDWTGDAAGDSAEEDDEVAQDWHVELFTDDDDEERAETTALQARQGKDLQGILWEATPWRREEYRAKRDAEYPSYYNLEEEVKAAEPAIAAAATAARPPSSGPLFEFYRNWRRVRSSIVHFQLRNLLWATTAHDLYYVADNRVMHWTSTGRGEPDVVIDVSGRAPSAVAPNLGPVTLCTLCAKEGLVAGGGFAGEVVARRIGGQEAFAASLRVTTAENGITNAIDIYRTPAGALRLACSNNDGVVRLLDGEAFAPVGRFDMPWAVNFCCAQPLGRLMCAVGDDQAAQILDPASGRPIAHLRGHSDYSFAAAWHPDGMVVATGNQDKTTRVYDLRAPKSPLALLRAHIGAVRCLRFTADGRCLAAAESADYVTVYDVATGYEESQSVDLFGEIAGVAFTPAGDRLWVAVADLHYSSAVQLDRARPKRAPDLWSSQ